MKAPLRTTDATMLNTAPTPMVEMLPTFLREGRRYSLTLTLIFAAIAIASLVVGMVWPKSYVATTSILAQSSDIITPLLEGRAVPTGVTDRAGMARQVIFGRKVLTDVLETGGWMKTHPTPIEQDRIIEQIKDHTQINSPRPELVQITYRDSDPQRTFEVTRRFAHLFIEESRAAKERESRDAFEFIDNQVTNYHKKLTSAEAGLLKYRSENADAQPGSATDANSRISALRTQVEQARTDLMEQKSREAALLSQLSGESEVTAVQTREGMYRAQLIDLQNQLDRLLLTYTDQYPDVVRTRMQMEDIKKQIKQEQERSSRAKDGKQTLSDDAQFNPLYQTLKGQLANLRQEMAATRSRMSSNQNMLNDELDRSRRIAASESALAELTRDYEVNRDIYQDLLKRRENARVSMVLDEEQRGLTFRIQDPAILPLRPSGLRLVHFALGGMLLALAVPFGLLYALVQFDPRIRSARQLERTTGLVVLASIPTFSTARERMRTRLRLGFSGLLVVAVVAAYVLVYWSRVMKFS
ncbi:MAG TPA: XrtA system polysaccharide chain length determinant [Dokdonella sp.]|uniref:XrtA system polysaccharide chain length determinant n=1 Tax=Dokdonella sp. TaxID=2291710 RepID=UPI002D801CCE|nr:XrtA system polysaccharide chain length determinant [Dokdonella sp.]HET9033620.1 XrtA system polysaccharide chain length determinant [Dokdonella sp.]